MVRRETVFSLYDGSCNECWFQETPIKESSKKTGDGGPQLPMPVVALQSGSSSPAPAIVVETPVKESFNVDDKAGDIDDNDLLLSYGQRATKGKTTVESSFWCDVLFICWFYIPVLRL